MRTEPTAPSGSIAEPRTAQPNIGLELVRATEAAALSAGRWMGNMDRDGIRLTASSAMREALAGVHMSGTILIGEEGTSSALSIGQRIGDGMGEQWEVALKPIDGSTLVAKGLPNAVSVIATAEPGSLVKAPVGLYAEKIAVGPDARGS
ncbi:MAG: fructose-bisphosphatase class II family protein, partial [Chloroflexi bacterium]